MKLINLILVAVAMLTMNIHSENENNVYLEIFTPQDYITTNSNEIHIIGKSNAQMIEMYINGKLFEFIIVKDSIFHTHAYYGYGLNEIKFIPVDREKLINDSIIQTIEIMYSPVVEKKYSKIYKQYKFHDKKKNIRNCTPCHLSTYSDLDSINDESYCLVCHTHMKENFQKHTQVDNRICVNCHLLGDTSRSTFDNNPCLNCHKEKIGLFDKNYIHGPVAGGSCSICHDPHGSNYENNLVNAQLILCFSCHVGFEDKTLKRVLHKPFKNGNCSACHDPHSTNNKWVLIKRSEELCLNCHMPQEGLKWHTHPYNVKPKYKRNTNLRLTDEGNLECLSCHNAHSSNSEHLLITSKEFTCIGCHESKL